jgi:hypothetical protein
MQDHRKPTTPNSVTTEGADLPGAPGDATEAHRTEHELISFAVFLGYRARRMRTPVAVAEVPGADAPTTDVRVT